MSFWFRNISNSQKGISVKEKMNVSLRISSIFEICSLNLAGLQEEDDVVLLLQLMLIKSEL